MTLTPLTATPSTLCCCSVVSGRNIRAIANFHEWSTASKHGLFFTPSKAKGAPRVYFGPGVVIGDFSKFHGSKCAPLHHTPLPSSPLPSRDTHPTPHTPRDPTPCPPTPRDPTPRDPTL